MAEVPISNWITLKPGIPVRLHFSDHSIQKVKITDPTTKFLVDRERILFLVDRLDGSPISKTFSVLSERLAGELAPYLVDKRYTRYEFVIVKDAPGTVPPRVAQVIPL